jgi:hypothetical protein
MVDGAVRVGATLGTTVPATFLASVCFDVGVDLGSIALLDCRARPASRFDACAHLVGVEINPVSSSYQSSVMPLSRMIGPQRLASARAKARN